MKPDLLRKIAEEANLAPSVHNTQPVRWTLDGPGAILLSLDRARKLHVGDPSGNDARLSGGAALHGTIQALARHGKGVLGWEHDGDRIRVALGGDPLRPPEIALLRKRTTYRAGFAASGSAHRNSLALISGARSDTTLTVAPQEIAALSELNDSASLRVMRNSAFRRELLDWMRLDRRHPNWLQDGLSAEALALSRTEAFAAGIALRKPFFEAFDALGLSRMIVSEDQKTRSATGLLAFHRPGEEDRWTSGTHFYDLWIALTEAGFAAWPMAVLADDPEANAEVARRMKLPEDHTLITVLRVGPHPGNRQPAKARLAPEDLVTTA